MFNIYYSIFDRCYELSYECAVKYLVYRLYACIKNIKYIHKELLDLDRETLSYCASTEHSIFIVFSILVCNRAILLHSSFAALLSA